MKNIGPVTFYPLRSAMHGAINIRTKRWGYICFKPPTRVFKRWWPAYFYLSPNATPWGATLLLGRGYSCHEKKLAKLRKLLWGHGYSTEEHNPQENLDYEDSVRELCGHDLSEIKSR